MTDAPSPPPADPVRKTGRRARSPHGPGLFVTDGELYDLLGVPRDLARATIDDFDRHPGQYRFPQKQKAWGDRRYYPAVQAWLEHHHGFKMPAPVSYRRAS